MNAGFFVGSKWMKDTSKIWYEVLLANEQTGEKQSLGIGRDFQVMLLRDSALTRLTLEQRADGWDVKIEERKDLGAVLGTRGRGGSGRRRNTRGRGRS
jgi:hypothetical protein